MSDSGRPMNYCDKHDRCDPCPFCQAIDAATADLTRERDGLESENARLAALVESQRSIMLRIAAHVTPIRDADQEQQHANDVAATMDRLDDLDDIVNSRVCDLECDAAQAESRAEWYALLARAANKGWLSWDCDEAHGLVTPPLPVTLDASGLPVENEPLRAALLAALSPTPTPAEPWPGEAKEEQDDAVHNRP